MKQFLVKFKDKDAKEYELKLFYRSLEECKKQNLTAINIEECLDYSYLEYIDKIKENGTKISDNFYKITIDNGFVFVRFYEEDDLLLDFVEYQRHLDGLSGSDLGWTWLNPKKFYEMYIKNDISNMELYSFRCYGEPKLPKPKELKGIKQSFAVDFIEDKCRCQCFVKDNDLYIKHRDYFSKPLEVEQEDFDKPLDYLCKKYLDKYKSGKFVYSDCFGEIILRNEAWIKVNNIIPKVDIMNSFSMGEYLFRMFKSMTGLRERDFLDTTWERFWENVSKELYKFLNDKGDK